MIMIGHIMRNVNSHESLQGRRIAPLRLQSIMKLRVGGWGLYQENNYCRVLHVEWLSATLTTNDNDKRSVANVWQLQWEKHTHTHRHSWECKTHKRKQIKIKTMPKTKTKRKLAQDACVCQYTIYHIRYTIYTSLVKDVSFTIFDWWKINDFFAVSLS